MNTVPDLLPGLPDPLAWEVLRPTPDDWPCRPGVRTAHVAAMERLLAAELPPPQQCQGSGVVYVGGGAYWPGIVVGVRMLREFSKLPVQIWYRGNSEKIRAADLAGVEGVAFIDADRFFQPAPRMMGGWQLKSLALLHCPWEKVLYLDGDAYCVSDPEPIMGLLDSVPFVFWKDLDSQWGNINWHWWNLEFAKGRQPPPVQGGQVFLNRRTGWRFLVVVAWLNQHSDYSYHFPAGKPAEWHGYGDQDTLRVGLHATRLSYSQLGWARVDGPAMVCEYNSMPVVVHRVNSKLCWQGRDVRTDYLPVDAKVFAYLDEWLGMAVRPEMLWWDLYTSGAWGAKKCCGSGSVGEVKDLYLEAVNAMISANGWRSVVDLGCGDGKVSEGLLCESLTGVDVAHQHIISLEKRLPHASWLTYDLYWERGKLPVGNVALLKDVLHHWPTRQVQTWVNWARFAGKWRAVVYCFDCEQADDNADCEAGGYRALDPSLRPLSELGLVCVFKFCGKAICVQTCG